MRSAFRLLVCALMASSAGAGPVMQLPIPINPSGLIAYVHLRRPEPRGVLLCLSDEQLNGRTGDKAVRLSAVDPSPGFRTLWHREWVIEDTCEVRVFAGDAAGENAPATWLMLVSQQWPSIDRKPYLRMILGAAVDGGTIAERTVEANGRWSSAIFASDSVILVGMPSQNDEKGAVYRFSRADLRDAGPCFVDARSGHLGWSMCRAPDRSDTILVGAPSTAGCGAVYSLQNAQQELKLLWASRDGHADFGAWIAATGSISGAVRIAVSAPRFGCSLDGAVFLYDELCAETRSTRIEAPSWSPFGTPFGYQACLIGNGARFHAFVGDPAWTSLDGDTEEDLLGATYRVDDGGTPTRILRGIRSGNRTGMALIVLDDLDGDGVPEIASSSRPPWPVAPTVIEVISKVTTTPQIRGIALSAQ